MRVAGAERAAPNPPEGGWGVGEPPGVSARPAVVNATRDATGSSLPHTPAAPERTVGTQPR